MSLKTRKLLAICILFFGLPAYIVGALMLVDLLDRPHIIVETLIYIVLGVLWALPLRSIFRGVAREDPDA